jgi:hypothetical protein
VHSGVDGKRILDGVTVPVGHGNGCSWMGPTTPITLEWEVWRYNKKQWVKETKYAAQPWDRRGQVEPSGLVMLGEVCTDH